MTTAATTSSSKCHVSYDKSDDMETKEQIHEITKQVNEIQQTVHRHMDYNRKMNGERIVLKKEQEMFIQSIRKTLKQISHVYC